jgi:cell division protein FtsI/penicillin-binding protein 2
MNGLTKSPNILAIKRIRIWFSLLIIVMGVFIVRLFYLQVIKFSYYHQAALNDQQKQYQILPTRGIIEAEGPDGNPVPIVLNQVLYTLYADPTLIKDPAKDASVIAKVIGGNSSDYEAKLDSKATRYVVLKNKLSEAQSKAVLINQLPGIGTQSQDYRIYPQGTLAAQILGFVDNAGKGEYGLEQAFNKQLTGIPGQLKAVTDINGVPLVTSKNNIQKPPTKGSDVVLTINIALQKQLEEILQNGLKNAQSQSGSALIMDPNNGEVKAMANWPSYNPGDFANVTDQSVFNNAAITDSIEVGSTMKVFTTSAALDLGVIKPDTTYYDPAQWTIDGYKITNIEEDGGPGVKSLDDLLNLSLNTGATWLLMQMGGGQLNQKGRDAWHNYMTNHFQFGNYTGIEQGYESSGLVPNPDKGYGLNLTYANTAFGQAMTATALQMGGALSSVVNGGTYYQPHIVDETFNTNGGVTIAKPKILASNVVSPKVTQAMIPLMQYVVEHHAIVPQFDQTNYTVGGKTGTAQIAKPGGGYEDSLYNGTYIGFVGSDKPQYVIVVFVDKPKIPGYAGAMAAQPIFASLAHMLINESYVSPKAH